MTWQLDYTDSDNRRWQYNPHCSLTFNEFAKSLLHNEEGTPVGNITYQDRVKWLNDIGLTEEKFNELKSIQGNCEGLISCGDPNTKFINTGAFADKIGQCMSRNCYCLCADGYEPDSNAKCVETQQKNAGTPPIVNPEKILGGVAVGIGAIIIYSIYTLFRRKPE